MKPLLLFLAFTLPFFKTFAQQNSRNNRDSVFTYVEKMPSFAGGQDSMLAYIGRNIHYPGEALVNNQQGVCFVSFVVDSSGIVKNVIILKSAAPSLDAEALRIVKMMPRWEPGIHNQKKAAVKFTLPIRFQLPPATEKEEDEDVAGANAKNMPDEQPQFPGGTEGLVRFLKNNVKYPEPDLGNNTQGLVVISFIVNRDGSISDHKIIKSLSPSTNKEAIRILQAMPLWIPAKKNGMPVRAKCTLPIRFAL